MHGVLSWLKGLTEAEIFRPHFYDASITGEQEKFDPFI